MRLCSRTAGMTHWLSAKHCCALAQSMHAAAEGWLPTWACRISAVPSSGEELQWRHWREEGGPCACWCFTIAEACSVPGSLRACANFEQRTSTCWAACMLVLPFKQKFAALWTGCALAFSSKALQAGACNHQMRSLMSCGLQLASLWKGRHWILHQAVFWGFSLL